MEARGFGWVRDLPDHRDLLFTPPPEVAEALPQRIDLRAGFTAAYDQGRLGSCTANAIAGALQFLEAKEGSREPIMPSRLFIYYNERVIEGTVESDSGAQIRDGIKSVAREGFCAESMWPYDVAHFSDRPPENCYTAAYQERVSQYLRLGRSPAALLSCLATGYPFVFGFSVYESFESDYVRETGIVELPNIAERLVGGHAVVAAGYDLHTRRFTVRNSWGVSWGVDGYFTIPFDYLTNPRLSADFWTIRKVPIQ
jgi:C1A family cysteine protease